MAYVHGDPINLNDPSGLLAAASNGPDCGPDWIMDPSLRGPCEVDPNESISVVTWREWQVQETLQSANDLFSQWQWGTNTSRVILGFQGSTADIVISICVVQPELCVAAAVGGTIVSIYVMAPQLKALFDAIRRGITAKDMAPVYYPSYQSARDDNGDCEPPDPNKYVKWRGTTGSDHWHWWTWNQRKDDCMNFPDWGSGPDPGKDWHEIPPK